MLKPAKKLSKLHGKHLQQLRYERNCVTQNGLKYLRVDLDMKEFAWFLAMNYI